MCLPAVVWNEVAHWHGAVDVHLAKPIEAVSLAPLQFHFRRLVAAYSEIHIYNLLSDWLTGPRAAEAHLGQAYKSVVALAQAQDGKLANKVDYEWHSIDRNELRSSGLVGQPKVIAQDLERPIAQFGATVAQADPATGKYTLLEGQRGTFRVNCRECVTCTVLEISAEKAH